MLAQVAKLRPSKELPAIQQEQIYPSVGAQCDVVDGDGVTVPRLVPRGALPRLDCLFQLLNDFLCDDFINLVAHIHISLSFVD